MDDIKAFLEIDFVTVFLSVILILVALKFLIMLGEWFITKLGLETKNMRKRREYHELIISNAKAIQNLSQKHDTDTKQSIKHDKIICEDLKKLTNTVEDIVVKLEDMEAKIDATEMAKLKEKILGYYRKYKDIGEWQRFESDVFWGLYDRYISHGGNSFVEKEIEPVMRKLKIKD